jgi:hypothetical protein
MANISSIFKNKGSRLDLNNDRGIFILAVLRKILDKLNYQEKYPHIDSAMSDSNIGARKGRNIKNHLFMLYGIINSVLKEENYCLDVQIYDLVQCFDGLWLEDCMNDMYDSLPGEQQDDKLGLIYESNVNNLVAVNTPVGQTDRVNIQKIVTQGGTFGPIECSNSIDTIGKKCLENGQHLYTYKHLVKVMPLSMVDDILAVSKCGQDSLSVNTYINTEIELKKLKFHTPDKNGKTKCHKMHIGKVNKVCPELKVHGTRMVEVSEDTYLGDIISSNGSHSRTIQARVGKGIGIISKIMSKLERITVGEHYFPTAILLRDSLYINGIMTNAETWYGLSSTDIKPLEDLDVLLLRKIFNAQMSVPIESLYLELGCLDIHTILKARRIHYLHYLANRKDEEMLNKFFQAQWKYPTTGDWTEHAKQDLQDFNMDCDLEYLRTKSKEAFKSIVRRKATEYALFKYLEKKNGHTKLDNLYYTGLSTQEYLTNNDLTVKQAQLIFKYRVRMASYSENFRGSSGHTPCPLCLAHLDSQAMCMTCPAIRENVKLEGRYSQIFTNKITKELVKTVEAIDRFRDDFLQSRYLE